MPAPRFTKPEPHPVKSLLHPADKRFLRMLLKSPGCQPAIEFTDCPAKLPPRARQNQKIIQVTHIANTRVTFKIPVTVVQMKGRKQRTEG